MFPNSARSNGLHDSMFMHTLLHQMSREQREKWLPLASSYKVWGTYAQTELGHGNASSVLLPFFLKILLNLISIIFISMSFCL